MNMNRNLPWRTYVAFAGNTTTQSNSLITPKIISLKNIHLYVLLKTATYVECKARYIGLFVKVCLYDI